MNIIRLSLWFLVHTTINSIKRSWKGLLIFFAIMIVVIGGITISTLFISDDTESESSSSSSKTEEEEIDIIQLTATTKLVFDDSGIVLYTNEKVENITYLVVNIIIGCIVLGMLVWSIYRGNKKGMSIFQMPDVNFLFPSPRKPQSILLFRMVGQIGMTLAASAYLIFQIPNLVANFGISFFCACLLLFGVIALSIFAKFFKVFVYVITSRKEKVLNYITSISIGLMLFPFLIVAVLYQGLGYSITDALECVFSSTASNLVPFWGWFKGFLQYAIVGEYLPSMICLALLLISTVLLIWITWRIPCDFYEDALTSANELAAVVESMERAGQGGIAVNVTHSERSNKKWDAWRNRMISFAHSEGSKVFFTKTIGNRTRLYPLHGLMSKSARFYFSLSVGMAIVMLLFNDQPSLAWIIISLAVVVFFRSFVNPLEMDLDQIFLYMIPESPFSTLGYGMLGQIIDGALDLLPSVVVSTLLIGCNPLESILWYLILVSLHTFFSSAGLFIGLVFGNYLPTYVVNILHLFLRAVPLIPIILVFLVSALLQNFMIAMLGIIIINLVCSIVLFLPCPSFLHRGKR